MYVSQYQSWTERREALSRRIEFEEAASITRYYAREDTRRAHPLPQIVRNTIKHERLKVLELLWDNEGTTVIREEIEPYVEAAHATSPNTRTNDLDTFITGTKQKIDGLGIIKIIKMGKEGYMLLSQERTSLPSDVLMNIRSGSTNQTTVIMLTKLLRDAPNIVTYEEIHRERGQEEGPFKSKPLRNSVTLINGYNTSEHHPFLEVQSERKTGYRLLTTDHVPQQWLDVLSHAHDFEVQDADMLIHFLTREGHIVTVEEIRALFPEGMYTNKSSFSIYMGRFADIAKKAGVEIEPLYEKRKNPESRSKTLQVTGYQSLISLPVYPPATEEKTDDEYSSGHVVAPEKNTTPTQTNNEPDEDESEEYSIISREEEQILIIELTQAKEVIRLITHGLQEELGLSEEEYAHNNLQHIPTETDTDMREHISEYSTSILKKLKKVALVHGDAEVTSMGHQLANALDHYHEVRQKLCAANYRWAWKLAGSFMKKYNIDLNNRGDFNNAAVMGLIKGVDKHDPSYETRISTYATWWINSALQEEQPNHRSGYKVSRSNQDESYKIRKRMQEMEDSGEGSDIAIIAEELGMSTERAEALSNLRGTASLDKPIGTSDDGGSLGEMIGSSDNGQTAHDAREELQKVLSGVDLSDIERQILVLVKGLSVIDFAPELGDVFGPLGIPEISEVLEISRKKVKETLFTIDRKLTRVGKKASERGSNHE